MTDTTEIDPKRELAKLKRLAQEIASEIHDIVEDTYLEDYEKLRPLSEKAIEAVKKYYAFKNEKNL